MKPKDQTAYLFDILDSAYVISGYIANVTKDKFLANNMMKDAVAKRIEVIGEAVAKLSVETKQQMPEVPFDKIRAARNFMAHAYGETNFSIVWDIATLHIKPLITSIETYFKNHQLEHLITQAKNLL